MQAWLTNNNNNNAGRSRSLFSSATLREEAGSGRHGFHGGAGPTIGDPRIAMVVPSCRSDETGVSTPSHNRRRDHRIRPTKRQYRGLGQ